MPIPGSIPIGGFIAPTSSEDTYAVIDPIYGIDGLRSVANLTERNNITDSRRRVGMIVYDQDGDKYYKLISLSSGNGNDVWVETLSASGGDTFITGGTVSGNNLTLTDNNGTDTVVDVTSLTTDTYVTGSTLSGNTLTLMRNNGLADITTDMSSLAIDTFTTGGTVSGNTLTLRTNVGSDVSINVSTLALDTFTTGMTLSGSTLSLIPNAGSTITTTITGLLTGLTTGGRIPYTSGTNILTDSANLVWDNTTGRLTINAPASPTATLDINPSSGLASIRMRTSTPTSAVTGEIWFNTSTGINLQGALNFNDNSAFLTGTTNGFTLTATNILRGFANNKLIVSLMGDGVNRDLVVAGVVRFSSTVGGTTAGGASIDSTSGNSINLNSFNNNGAININGQTTILRNLTTNAEYCLITDPGAVVVASNADTAALRVQRGFTGCSVASGQTSAINVGINSLIDHKGSYANTLYNSIGIIGGNLNTGNTTSTIRAMIGGAFYNTCSLLTSGTTTGVLNYGLLASTNLVGVSSLNKVINYTSTGSLYLGNPMLTASSGSFYHIFMEDAGKATYTNILSPTNTIARPSFTNIWNLFIEGTQTTGTTGKSYISNGLGVAFATQTGATAVTALVHIGPGTTTNAQIRLTPGSAPTGATLFDGDIWYNGTDLFIRKGATTHTVTTTPV